MRGGDSVRRLLPVMLAPGVGEPGRRVLIERVGARRGIPRGGGRGCGARALIIAANGAVSASSRDSRTARSTAAWSGTSRKRICAAATIRAIRAGRPDAAGPFPEARREHAGSSRAGAAPPSRSSAPAPCRGYRAPRRERARRTARSARRAQCGPVSTLADDTCRGDTCRETRDVRHLARTYLVAPIDPARAWFAARCAGSVSHAASLTVLLSLTPRPLSRR